MPSRIMNHGPVEDSPRAVPNHDHGPVEDSPRAVPNHEPWSRRGRPPCRPESMGGKERFWIPDQVGDDSRRQPHPGAGMA